MRFHDESTDLNVDHDGSAPRAETVTRWFRAWGPIAVLLVSVLPLPALGAKLIEVRVGRHPGYTRVVLQTDAPIEYVLTRSPTGNLRIALEADASPRRLASKSDVLREVIVEKTGEGSLARLRLHRTDVAVKEMVLTNPPRIVLDLTPGVPQPQLAAAEAPVEEDPEAQATPAEAQPEAAPSEVAEPEPEPVKAEPTLAASTAAAAGGRLGDSKVEPTPESGSDVAEVPSSAPAIVADESVADESAADTVPQVVDGSSAESPEPSAAADGQAADSGEEAVADDETGDSAEEAVADAGDAAEEAEPPTEGVVTADSSKQGARLREMPAPPPARGSSPPEPPPAAAATNPGVFAFLPAPLDDPLVLGGIAGLLVLVAALVAVRRRGAARAEEDLESPFASPEPFAEPVESSSSTSFDVPASVANESSRDGDLPAVPGQEPGAESSEPFSQHAAGFEEGDSLFSGGADAEEEKDADARAFAPVPAVDLGAADAPPPGGDVMRAVEELERRMGQMETRLEEVMDAKERLERQVSAQTEELRVQRAAIARTQRVLRNVSRPEDEATEPAPKV